MPDGALLREAQDLQTLEHAFRWALARQPRLMPDDVIMQDEYTHDVLFRAAGERYVVFDAT